MSRVIGRKGGETYPERRSVGASSGFGAFAFDQNENSYQATSIGPSVQIATATINVAAGSRVKIEGLASFLASVAGGVARLSVPDLITDLVAAQSFGTTEGTNFRTLNLLGVTDPQSAGPVVVNLLISVNSGIGSAQVNDSGKTCLTLTEVLAD